MLYEMVSGRAPFSAETTGEVMTSILETEPPPFTNYNAQIPAELEQIIRRTLRKERENATRAPANCLTRSRCPPAHGLEHRVEKLSRASCKEALDPIARCRGPRGLVAALALALPYYWHRNQTSSTPEKSIAVLPFENLSDDKENGSFAAGFKITS